MDEIKPCPFCGSAAVVGPIRDDYRGDAYSPYYWIECVACPCFMEVDDENKSEIIKLWNTRKGGD